METIVIGTDPTTSSINSIMAKVGPTGAEVRNDQGQLIAYVYPPNALTTYAGPEFEFGGNLKDTMSRRGGKTTQELLEKLNSIPLPADPS